LLRRLAPRNDDVQFGARHFDKIMFNLPIPRFESGSLDGSHSLPKIAEALEVVGVLLERPSTKNGSKD
jgi:hypothetical protein